ncbi:MAG: inositol monophosphatase family protein [Candidatus Binatia bacterium]
MPDELTVATELAREAGSLIKRELTKTKRVDHKAAVDLVTDVDLAAEKIIKDGLTSAFPLHQIVAEESSAGRPGDGQCWYVDPIDGTVNFVHGLPHCAVSIAFLDGGRPRAAVVLDPCKDECFQARLGQGATLNGEPIVVSDTSTLDAALLVTGFPYDRRQRSAFYLRYFEAFLCKARDLRRFGSAALDLCYVACGRFDGFWEWYLQPWDTAAGWLMVEEAGGQVSDFDGSPYDLWSPRILATNGRVHGDCRNLMRGLLQGDDGSMGPLV